MTTAKALSLQASSHALTAIGDPHAAGRAYQRLLDEKAALEQSVRDLEAKLAEALADAARWQALMSSARVRYIGSARLDGDCSDALLCVEFHAAGSDEQDGVYGREGLIKYADSRRSRIAGGG